MIFCESYLVFFKYLAGESIGHEIPLVVVEVKSNHSIPDVKKAMGQLLSYALSVRAMLHRKMLMVYLSPTHWALAQIPSRITQTIKFEVFEIFEIFASLSLVFYSNCSQFH